MKNERKQLSHNIPDWVNIDEAVFFVTLCCSKRGVNQLCKADLSSDMFEAIENRVSRNLWYPHLVLLMPDHLHMLVTFNHREIEMKSVISTWKGWCRKKIGVRWQDSYFDHRLRSDESLKEKADYILNNPVRAGHVEDWRDWGYIWFPG